jgi:hypothetical protein
LGLHQFLALVFLDDGLGSFADVVVDVLEDLDQQFSNIHFIDQNVLREASRLSGNYAPDHPVKLTNLLLVLQLQLLGPKHYLLHPLHPAGLLLCQLFGRLVPQ